LKEAVASFFVGSSGIGHRKMQRLHLPLEAVA